MERIRRCPAYHIRRWHPLELRQEALRRCLRPVLVRRSRKRGLHPADGGSRRPQPLRRSGADTGCDRDASAPDPGAGGDPKRGCRAV